MYYLVPKMCLSHQSKVDSSDNAKINVLYQGTVDNCRQYPAMLAHELLLFLRRNSKFI